jgi:hypothetical protein
MRVKIDVVDEKYLETFTTASSAEKHQQKGPKKLFFLNPMEFLYLR